MHIKYINNNEKNIPVYQNLPLRFVNFFQLRLTVICGIKPANLNFFRIPSVFGEIFLILVDLFT